MIDVYTVLLLSFSRIVLPISVDEYQVGQLYAVIEASKNETGGGDGVEVITNEPYEENGEKGQYTHKIYHLSSKVPTILRKLAPKGSLEVHEKAWNAYPYCRTNVQNPYMKDGFQVKIETWHKPDLGSEPNVHGLSGEQLKKREIVDIDIAKPVDAKDYKEEYDPTKFKSTKRNREPLKEGWKDGLASSNEPHMCAYKLVTIEFKWLGLQKRIEELIERTERRIFTNFHRQLYCTLDNWIDLNMEDIRRLEAITKTELDEVTINSLDVNTD
ncbi:phosphatidylinositol transfer protein alpha isoform-like [Neosynchiropus ocellatus]